MATNTNPIFLRTVLTPALQFINADGTTEKQVVLAGVDGGAVTQLTATSDSTADATLIISINDAINTNPIGEVLVPAGSGTDGTNPPIDLLNSTNILLLQNDGSVLLGPGASLEVSADVAVVDNTVFVTAMGGSYSA